jgi:cytochrome c oxidase assembly protein subunit 15
MFTSLIILTVGWVIIAARLQRPRVRSVTRLAWSQFWLVVANALAGGVSVLAQLNPWVVALHFTLAIALLATTTLTWHRVHENRSIDPTPLSSRVRGLSWALAATTAALVLVGTMVSGTGPHSGDSSDVPRMGLNWTTVTVVHGALGATVLVLAIVLLFALGSSVRDRLVRKRLIVFLIVFAAQGLVGVIQSLSGLPETLVSFHLLGAALVWVGVLRVLLDANPMLFASVGFRKAEQPIAA